jgi:hypothetical protein
VTDRQLKKIETVWPDVGHKNIPKCEHLGQKNYFENMLKISSQN